MSPPSRCPCVARFVTAPSSPGCCSSHTCSSSSRRSPERSGSMPSPTGTSTPADPYQVGVGGLGAFNYTPPIARLFGPFGALEWPTFLWLWLALLIGNIIWLGGRGVRIIWLLAFPPVALELYHGNIHLWIAAAIALGFRYPWTWGFVLLTKVTPGVGLLWFAVRREWRALGDRARRDRRHRRGLARARGPALGRLAGVHRLDAGRRLRGPVPDPDPALDPPAGGGRARRVGRPDRPALDGRPWRRPWRCPVLWVSGFAICAALASTSLWPKPDAPVSRRSVRPEDESGDVPRLTHGPVDGWYPRSRVDGRCDSGTIVSSKQGRAHASSTASRPPAGRPPSIEAVPCDAARSPVTALQSLVAELAITLADGAVWLSIGQGLLFGASACSSASGSPRSSASSHPMRRPARRSASGWRPG